MKKIIISALVMTLLCGCKTQPKMYNSIDYSVFDTEDYHVIYVESSDSCYSDGCWEANRMFNTWMEKYEKKH